MRRLPPSKGLQRVAAGAAIKRAISKSQKAPRPKCPVHGIPDCSPLLNGCSWKPEK